MQTSGNPRTWQYAFTVDLPERKERPRWIQQYHGAYIKNYENLTVEQIKDFSQSK
jgi:hypothetical protein